MPRPLLPTVEKALSKPGSDSYAWGFYLYRTTYYDNALWNRYMAYIHENAREYIRDGSEDERVSKKFRIYVIEGSDLDGASIEEVRELFLLWRKEPKEEATEVSPSNHKDTTLTSYPLYVDEQCLESMRAHEQLEKATMAEFDHHVLIKALNAEPDWDEIRRRNGTENDEEDLKEGAEHEDDSDDEEEASEDGYDYDADSERDWGNPAYRWMLVSCRDLVSWWSIMAANGEWDRQYELCSRTGNLKRPWSEELHYDGPFYSY